MEIAIPKNQYTYIVFDTPPNLEHAASLVAVQQADVIIIVTGQTVVDFWEVSEAVEFAETTNPGAAVRVLIDRVKTGTILARSVEDSVAALKIKALKLRSPTARRSRTSSAEADGTCWIAAPRHSPANWL